MDFSASGLQKFAIATAYVECGLCLSNLLDAPYLEDVSLETSSSRCCPFRLNDTQTRQQLDRRFALRVSDVDRWIKGRDQSLILQFLEKTFGPQARYDHPSRPEMLANKLKGVGAVAYCNAAYLAHASAARAEELRNESSMWQYRSSVVLRRPSHY